MNLGPWCSSLCIFESPKVGNKVLLRGVPSLVSNEHCWSVFNAIMGQIRSCTFNTSGIEDVVFASMIVALAVGKFYFLCGSYSIMAVYQRVWRENISLLFVAVIQCVPTSFEQCVLFGRGRL